ncbi:MAG: transglutaminase-like domain-containing protein [Nitrospirota bacterium]|nr:transglutaminase-like domain-containing protein [Nitrospirota bacterium]
MAEVYYRATRVAALVVLFFYSWTLGGVFDVAYAVGGSAQHSALSGQRNKQRPEERLQKAIEDIEVILADTAAGPDAKKDRLRGRKADIEGLDIKIREQFKETEDRIKDLPEAIKQRHRGFIKKYEDNLSAFKAHLDDIDRSETASEKEHAYNKAKEFLQRVKPPKKHIPVDPDNLPHKTIEPVYKEPRTTPWGISAEARRRESRTVGKRGSKEVRKCNNEIVLSSSSPTYPLAALRAYELANPVLVASNGSLDGLFIEGANSVIPAPDYCIQGQAPAGIQGSGYPIETFGYDSSGYPDSKLRTLNTELLLAATDPPTSDDLAETVEVRFTPAIKAKAAELEHDPVKIYNWVRNNIEFVPTYGSIQGTDMCLQTKLCNAFDTSSLLIALLRVSGIHARYVEGTVEIPIEKVMNWLGGFTDPNAALDLIASGGIPVKGLTSGGRIVAARMEHVWVEGWVDYIPYRGAVEGLGDTWIPLDASYKQHGSIGGLDVDSAVPTDFEALLAEVESKSMINTEIPSITYIPSLTIQDQISDFQAKLGQYMAGNFPQVDTYYELRDALHGYYEIVQKELRFLPNTLAGMKVIAKLNRFSEIPQSLRHKISFRVETPYDSGPLVYNTTLPEIAGKRITLSYAPANSEDAEAMADAEGILDFPLYLVEVVPELKIEGRTVASGKAAGMGREQAFQISFSRPDGNINMVKNTVQAGEYYAVGVDTNKVNFQYLHNRAEKWQPDTAEDRDDRLGELLYLTAMFYFAKADYFNDELAGTSGIVNSRQPSECIAGMRFNASYIFGVPLKVSSVGLNMDVDRDVISPVSKINDKDLMRSYMIQTGLYASGLEHALFESMVGAEAVSTIKLLHLAGQQGIPIYIIDSMNSQRIDELIISLADKQDMRNLVNTGRTVLVPQTTVQYFDYSGIGYAAIDTQTGAGAYMISGGYAGGDTVRENVDALVKLADELLGKNKRMAEGYKVAIETILKEYPDITDSPNEKFKEWTEMVLFAGELAKKIKDDRMRVIFGQQILYSIIVNLLGLEVDMIYKSR